MSNQVTIKPHVDATNLREDITLALRRSWFAHPDEIHVAAEGGHVWLTGSVHSLHERQVAGATAWSASGATMVKNDLAVV